MKLVIKRMTSCIMMMLILCFVLRKETGILQRKSSDYKYIPFYQHAEDMDVLFMGTSHVINAVFPMELWNDYGITSYNFGGHANPIATTYWVMENALDYSKPKVMVIDCMGISGTRKTAGSGFSYTHLSLDSFPLSFTKIRAVKDLLDDPETEKAVEDGKQTGEKPTKIGLLWDFSVYHSRWNEIVKNDFEQEKTKEYGAESRIRITAPGEILENPGTKMKERKPGLEYLQRMIDRCKEQGIKVILTYLPFPNSDVNKWIEINTLYDIAEENDVEFINYMDMNLVDFDTDCHDPNSHVNPSGAWKITDHIGKILRERYGVPDHRGEEGYKYWSEDYSEYYKLKAERLKKIEDLNTYLMLLEDKNYGYLMCVENPLVFQDKVTMNLLRNKGVDITGINEGTRYIYISGTSAAVFTSVDAAKEELSDRAEEDFSADVNQIKITVFDANDTSKIINTSIFNVPHITDMNERHPDKDGITFFTSRIKRA